MVHTFYCQKGTAQGHLKTFEKWAQYKNVRVLNIGCVVRNCTPAFALNSQLASGALTNPLS